MKIVTIGLSPYLLVSHARLHKWIMQAAYETGHETASIVFDHDTNYFFPEEKNGKSRFYYTYTHQDRTTKIPLFPIQRTRQPSIPIYEALQTLEPDIVITIGDLNDISYMPAVKTFCTKKFKWFAILANRSYPLDHRHSEIIDAIDGILCTSQFSHETIKPLVKHDILDFCYTGHDENVFNRLPTEKIAEIRKERNLTDKFRIFANPHNAQVDQVPMIMQAVADVRKKGPDLSLYLHVNHYDRGTYDLQFLKERFDPNSTFIHFPDKCVSLKDGYSDEELNIELNISDLYVSASMSSSTSMSVFEAIAAGCFPLLPDQNSDRNIAQLLEKHTKKNEYFTYPCLEFMTAGEFYMNMPVIDGLQCGIENLYAILTTPTIYRNYRKNAKELTQKFTKTIFIQRMLEMLQRIKHKRSTLSVEAF